MNYIMMMVGVFLMIVGILLINDGLLKMHRLKKVKELNKKGFPSQALDTLYPKGWKVIQLNNKFKIVPNK